MEIEYLPLKDRNLYGCFEHAYISVLNTYIGEYRLINKKSFNIQLCQQSFNNFNRDILQIQDKILQIALEYYGYGFKVNQLNNEENEELIKKELLEGNICIINLDLFWDSFREDYYKKKHTDYHARVVTGETEENYILYSWDDKYLLHKEDLKQGCLEVITLERFEVEKDIVKEELIKELIQDMYQFYCTDFIKLFIIIKQGCNDFNLYKEIREQKNLLGVAFFLNCRTLAKSRERVRDYILYLLSKEKEHVLNKMEIKLKEVLDLLKEVADKWWFVSNILIKEAQAFERDSSHVNKDINKRIELLVQDIEQIEYKLYNCIDTIRNGF